MNPEMKKIIEAIQKANPRFSERTATKLVVDFAFENLDIILSKVKLPKKRSKAEKRRDDFQSLRVRGGALRRAEIRSRKEFVDDLNTVRERLLDERNTADAEVVSREITSYEGASIQKVSALMSIDSAMTNIREKGDEEQKSTTEAKKCIKELSDDLHE